MFYAGKEFQSDLDDVLSGFLTHIRKSGYVVVADINVKEILKKALGEDFKDYHILEICKPVAAREIVGSDDLNGLFVPCKMIVYQDGNTTKIRVLRATEIIERLHSEATEIVGKYEKELFSLLDSFAM
jgi:uncharacterized protein (DUF302 family)